MNVIDMNVQETAESYLSKLLDLTSSDKQLIKALTILAEKNINCGQAIVDTIERRINKVEPDLKLPILYLIDSIIKNVGGKYTEYFGRSIVKIFVESFVKVNAVNRWKLYGLRQTWTGIFPRLVLSSLDARMKAIDPNWLSMKKRVGERDAVNEPDTKKYKSDTLFSKEDVDLRILQPQNVITLPGFSKAVRSDIYLHGKSIGNGTTTEVFNLSSEDNITKQSHHAPYTFCHQGHARTQLMANKSATKHNSYHTNWNSAWEKQARISSHASVPFKSYQNSMSRTNKYKNKQNFHQFSFVNQSFNRNHTQILPAENNQPNVASNLSGKPAEIYVQSLFQKLLKFGMIKNVEDKPTLDKPETLKKRNQSAISALYSGWQCGTCGIRLPSDQTTKHRDHLDWHYKQILCDKNAVRRAASQKWYYPENDWVLIDEADKLKEKKWFETEEKSLSELNQPTANCIAAHDEHNKVCDICHDPFEMFYDDDTEDWYLRNAIRKEQHVFHPICCED